MSHEFIPGEATESGYDECDGCGLLVDPGITAWVTAYCLFRPCTGTGNHGCPCVLVEEDGKAICSYCDRVGGSEDDADELVPWVDYELFAALLAPDDEGQDELLAPDDEGQDEREGSVLLY